MSLPESAPEAIAAPVAPRAEKNTQNGVLAALTAYTLWGFLPILFRELNAVGAVMIVAERTLWSLILLALVLWLSRRLDEVRVLFADRRKLMMVAVAAVLLGANWLIFVWAVETGQVLEASFGYFINPLVNVAMGMVLLGERQNRLQTLAIVIAVVAIGIQALGLGNVPYVALGLALSFGFYGYFRKTAMLGPTSGLFAETVLLAPLALAYVVWSINTTGWGVHGDPYLMTLLVLTGPATALPLMLFAYAVQQLRLTTIGMFQYIAPSIQFLVAILMFGEELNGPRLLSFALIWLSLAVFSWDSFRRRGRA